MIPIAYRELTAREVMDGWDSAEGYLFIKGKLGIASRGEPTRTAAPWQLYACVRLAVEHGELDEPAEFGPVEEGESWRGGVRPFTETQAVSAELLEAADRLHSGGRWVQGSYPGLSRPSLIVVKVAPNGEPVAVIAPCRRTDA